MPWPVVLALGVTVLVTVICFGGARRRRPGRGELEELATLRTLAFATSAVSALRQGLSASTAAAVLRSLVPQSGGMGAALYENRSALAFHAAPGSRTEPHSRHLQAELGPIWDALAPGRAQMIPVHATELDPSCPVRTAMVAPLVLDGRPVAALVTYHGADPSPAQLRVTTDLAELLATQLRLQRADQQQAELVRSELRALRAQISPHFVYNALNTIASFVRTDPERARELLIEFADFSRRAFSGPSSEFSSLGDELVYVNQYLTLEQARFGARLSVRYHIQPGVLSTLVPTLMVQPLVENAIKHGIERRPGSGTVVIEVGDRDNECLITVQDDGEGFSVPVDLGEHEGALGNINRRLNHIFGPSHGLEIESSPGHGTLVNVRIPKYRPSLEAP
jgi:two-component system LytT family sensor kinase